jgi:hypothetical protein
MPQYRMFFKKRSLYFYNVKLKNAIHFISCKRESFQLSDLKSKKGKAIPVTDRGGPEGCEWSRLPHFLESRLTDDGDVVNLTRRTPFTPQEDSWYSFLSEAVLTPGP